MFLFQSPAKPIWRQTWLRFCVMSGSFAGLAALVLPQLPASWSKTLRAQVAAQPTLISSALPPGSDAVPNVVAEPRPAPIDSVVRPYLAMSQLSYSLTEHVLAKHQATVRYKQAVAIAQQALNLRQQGNSVELKRQEIALWQDAVSALGTIPSDTPEYVQAQAKIKEYSTIATVVNRYLERQQSAFLKPIAAAGGNGSAVRIGLCQLGTTECRSFQGNVPPVSLASLVKLPLAVALMHQVTNAKASLDELIYIDPANFTENAQGAKIFVEKTYTLREVMVRMITESNNIATNQLIDYMGYDAINAALKAEGFTGTSVGHKLVGSKTFPKTMGAGLNRSTADELTQMMMRIYSFTKDSDEEILNALVGQYDLDFGYRALVKEKPNIFWIGEKTGQNSRVIGSTVAFKVGDERYVMTVTIDKSKSQGRLRQIIRDVARHVLDHGPLDQSSTAPKIARNF